jgi:hypothetical protein
MFDHHYRKAMSEDVCLQWNGDDYWGPCMDNVEVGYPISRKLDLTIE